MKFPEKIPDDEIALLRREWELVGGYIYTTKRGIAFVSIVPTGSCCDGRLYTKTEKGWVLLFVSTSSSCADYCNDHCSVKLR